MKIIKNNSATKKKALIICSFLLIILAASIISYVYAFNGSFFGWTSKSNSSNVNYKQATSDQKNTGIDIKRSNNSTNSAKNDSDQQITTPSDTSKKQPTSITIVRANQTPAGNLTIQAVVDVIESGNTCSITIKNGSTELYTATANTFPQSTYSACEEFNIPKEKLGNTPANLTITVTYDSAVYSGSTTKEISIQ